MILTPGHMRRLTGRLLPFSDAASEGLPLGQLLRLSLFQISVGMATVMLLGTFKQGDDCGAFRAGGDRGADDCHSRAGRPIPGIAWI